MNVGILRQHESALQRGLMFLVFIFLLTSCGLSPESVPLPPADPERIITHLEILASEDDARMAGWPGERDAAGYIAEQLESCGLQVRIQRFPVNAFRSGPATVVPDYSGSQGIPIPARSFLYGASSPPDGITARLVDGGLGRPRDLSGRQDIRGNILLIRRGEIWFSEKAANAGRAGAAAAVIYNNQPGSMIGVLLDPPGIPVVGIDGGTGDELAGMLADNPELSVTVNADTETVPSESVNVIGRRSGAGDDAPIIVIGAHLDSVDTPGANDNASGLAALLETARLLTASDRKFVGGADIRFIAFGSEEIGLLGSKAYVGSLSPDERNRFAGAVILDTLGAGNVLLIGTADSSAATEDLARRAEATAAAAGFSPKLEEIPASDHASFSRAGLPAILLINYPYDGIHSDADVIASVDYEITAATASLAAVLIEKISAGD